MGLLTHHLLTVKAEQSFFASAYGSDCLLVVADSTSRHKKTGYLWVAEQEKNHCATLSDTKQYRIACFLGYPIRFNIG
jgi:hypothetical protein